MTFNQEEYDHIDYFMQLDLMHHFQIDCEVYGCDERHCLEKNI